MLRRLQAFLVLGMWVVTVPAAAQEPTDEPPSEDRTATEGAGAKAAPAEPSPGEPTDKPPPKEPASSQAGNEKAAPPPAAEAKPTEPAMGFHTFVSGYFRAPLTIGISPRHDPDDPNGPAHTQLSYGPNRTVDSNYYSFAYTRLQEQDWAEVFIHAKRKHVEAVVGWMGYWYQSAGFRNPDASWVPGMAYLTLDSDVGVAGIEPNVALTAGAWWPKFGYFEKYDTYTLGQFRQLGEQLKLTIPFNPDLKVTLFQGFGAGRDGSFIYQINPPIYGAKTGIDLIAYGHLDVAYKKVANVGLHYNHEWTRDPNLFQQAVPGKSYADAREAHVTTIGGEANVSVPFAGRLWVSPSFITVKNGWALGANGGTEVMHSLGGMGLATNYLAWTNSPADSTGSGSMFNLGFLYENTLSRILGKERGDVMPEVTLNVFGLMMNANLDLPAGSVIPQDSIKQFKYGADVSVQALSWLGFMLRYDEVNYDLDNSGYIFSSITPRVTFSSHFLSGESIYVQYSRYRYGDNMVLAGKWPWGTPLVAGSDIVQGGPYSGDKPDMDVVKLQATVAF
jgi:hypothetical protein